MSILLWILQLLLAAAFFAHGWLFVAPPAEMVDVMNASFAPWFRIFIGIAELLGGFGLLLPGITRIQPHLTAWAAAGLATITGLAAILHLTRGEFSSAATTAVLCLLSAFVVYMRWRVKPFTARGVQQMSTESAQSM